MEKKSFILFGDLSITKETPEGDLKVSQIILNTYSDTSKIFDEAYSYYDDKKNYKNSLVDNCDILYKKWYKIEEIELWKYFKKNLISYINSSWDIGKRKFSWLDYIDCIDFSNYIMWKESNIVDDNKKLYSITKYFNKDIPIKDNTIKPININFINRIDKKPWEVFTIINIKDNAWHDIIYLWKDLYISKFWSWDIYITNIEEILNYYPSNIIVKKNNLFIQWIIWKWIEWKYEKFNLNWLK